MSSAIRRRVTEPAAPAYLALVATGGAAALYAGVHPAFVWLVWVLLGVTAGYSISGSV